jgi:putative inorganic carbon (hco3(-)) transporter
MDEACAARAACAVGAPVARRTVEMSMPSMSASATIVADDRGVRADGRLAPGALISIAPTAPLRDASLLSRGTDGLAFILLLLAAGTLLFRPADLLPVIRGAPIYELLMIACLTVGAPSLVSALSLRSFWRNGLLVLMLLLVPTVMLSHLWGGNTWDARIDGGEAFKAGTLAVLVVALVNTPLRLRMLMTAVVASVIAVTVLAILHYHGLLHVPALASIEQRLPNSGTIVLRLCGIGVFNDPNDFALLLVIAMSICAYGLTEANGRLARITFLAPLALFSYAFLLTHSRGGLIALVAAAGAFGVARIGWRNTIFLALLIGGPIAALASGRQFSVDLDDPNDTFQTRLQLWYEAMGVFWQAPILGVGPGQLVDRFGAVAHNSYLQAFTEMGFIGGTVFLGAFAIATRSVAAARPVDPMASRMRPCMLAIAVGYGAGLLSLSRTYTVPTQLVLALAAAYLTFGRSMVPPLDLRLARTLALASVGMILATQIFLRVMLR